MLACAVRFLAPVELVHVLLSCRKLLLLGFESNSDPSLEDTASYLNSILDSLSRKLLLDFMSIKGIGVSSLEDSPRNLLRGLAGVSINSFQTLKFTPKDQYNTYIVDVAVDSFPTTGGRSSWVGNRSLVPFAVILCDDEGDQALRLGSTKYFEISYSQGQATSINESKLSFGLSTYCQHSDDEEEFFLYKCSGRIVHKQTALVQGSHFRYHTGDVVGCGISYSLGSGAPGQIFFTKNGELMYVGHLPGGGTAIPWHAFTVIFVICLVFPS